MDCDPVVRIIADWFDAHWRRTDGKFNKRFGHEYNVNSVVCNSEMLWNHFKYWLCATARSSLLPSKAAFFNALVRGGIKLKPVKNRYVGSIRIAAAVRALRPASNATGIDIPPAFEQCGVQKRVRVQFTVES